MPNVINVRSGGTIREAHQFFENVAEDMPGLTREAMRDWGEILERELVASAKRAGIKSYTGTLFNTGIEWRQRPKGNVGKLFMRQYGIWLDQMSPHWVTIKDTRSTLLNWARRASSNTIRLKAARIIGGTTDNESLYVKPHPFIKQGLRRAQPKLDALLKNNIDKTGRRS